MANKIENVELQITFNNTQFERETKRSMQTLDKLKQSVDSAASTKSLESLGTSMKSVNVNGLGGVINTITKMGKRFSGLGIVGATAISKITNSVMDLGAKLATTVPNQIKQGGFTRALNIENAKFQIEGLGKVWDETSKGFKKGMDTIKQSVDYAVQDTAYGLDEAAVVASQLSASGIEAGEAMKTALRGVSGVAAMTNSSYADIGRIFTKIAGQGKAMNGELGMIADRGLNAKAVIADFMNGVNDGSIKASDSLRQYVKELTVANDATIEAQKKAAAEGKKGKKPVITDAMVAAADVSKMAKITEADIYEMAKDSQISFEIFYNAMDNAFGEHAKDANKTYAGSLSNVKAALSRIGADRSEVKLENLKNIFNALIPLINNVRYALEPLTIAINKFSIWASDKLVTKINSIAKVLEPAAKRGKELFSKWQETFSKIKAGVTGTADVADKAAEKTSKGVKKVAKEVSKTLTVTKKEAQAAWDIWTKGSYGNQPVREKNLAKAGLSFKTVQTYLNELIKCGFDESKMTIKVAKATKESTKAIKDSTKATKESTKVRKDNNNVIANSMTKVGEMADVLHGLTTEQITAMNWISAVTNFLKGGISILKQVIKGVQKAASVIKQRLAPHMLNLSIKVKSASEKFKEFADRLNKNKTITNGFVKIINGLFTAFDKLKQGITTVFNFFRNKIIPGFQKIFGPLFEKIKNGVEWLKNNETLQRFGKAILNLLKKFGEWISKTWVQIKEFFKELKQTEGVRHLKESLRQLWEIIKRFAGGRLNALTNLIDKFTGKEVKVNSLAGMAQGFGALADNIAKIIDAINQGKNPIEVFFKTISDTKPMKTLSYITGLKFGNGFGEFVNSLGKLKLGNAAGNMGKLAGVNFDVTKIKDGFSTFADFLKGRDWEKVSQNLQEWAKIFMTGGIIKDIKKFAQAFRDIKLFKNVNNLIESISGMFNEFSGLSKATQGFLKDYIALQKKKIRMDGFKSLAIGIALIAGSMFVLAQLPADKLERSGNAIGLIIATITAAMIALKQTQVDFSGVESFGKAVVRLGAGMLLLTIAMAAITKFSNEDLIRSGGYIYSFMVMMAACGRIAGKGNLKGFVAFSVALLLLIPSIMYFAHAKLDNLTRAATAIFFFATEIAGAGRLMGKGREAKGILAMAVAVGILAVSMKILSTIDSESLLTSFAAVSALLGEVALITHEAGGVNKRGAESLKSLALVVVAVAGSLAVLALFDTKQVLVSLAAIAGVMTTVAIVSKQASIGRENAASIGIVLAMVTAAFVLLGEFDTGTVMQQAIGMAALILSIGIVIRLMSKIDPGSAAMAAASFDVAFGIIIAAFYAAQEIFGIIVNECPEALANLEKGKEVMRLIGEGLGELIKPIVEALSEGFLSGIGKGIEDIGNGLKAFADKIKESSEALKEVKPEDFRAASTVVAEIMAIIGENFLDQFLTGGTSMDNAIESAGKLGELYKAYVTSISDIDVDSSVSEKAQIIASTLKALAEGMPKTSGGLKGLIEGFTDLQKLGEWLGGDNGFGASLKSFAPQISGLAKSYPSLPDDAAHMAKVLKCFNDKMPKTFRGLTGLIEGSTELDELGQWLGGDNGFGASLKSFAPQISGLAKSYPSLPDDAKHMAKVLKYFNDDMPTTFMGLKGLITGFSDLETLGSWLAGPNGDDGFGAKFVQFARQLVPIPDKTADKVKVISDTMNAFASGGEFGLLNLMQGGNKDRLDSLSEQLPNFATAFVDYSNNLEGLNTQLMIVAHEALSKMGTSLSDVSKAGIDAGQLQTLTQKLPAFGEALSQFYNMQTGIGGIDPSKTEDIVKSISEIGASMKEVDLTPFSSVGKESGQQFGEGLAATDVSSYVQTFMNNVAKGMSNQKLTVNVSTKEITEETKKSLTEGSKEAGDVAGKTTTKSTADSINKNKGVVKNPSKEVGNLVNRTIGSVSLDGAGHNLNTSLAGGISRWSWIPKAAASKSGKAVEQAYKNAFGIHSPARIMVLMGKRLNEGLALGIKKYASMAYIASTQMATETVNKTRAAVHTLSTMIENDQNARPVITPVLDTSQVSRDARSIGSSLKNTGLLAMTTSIRGNVNAKLQNDLNSANAIGNLSDRLNNLTESMNSRTMTNYITVDGAENPEQFADRFVRRLKLNMRMA